MYQNSVTDVFVGFLPPCWWPSRWAPALSPSDIFFCSKKPKKMKSKCFRFHFSKDTNKKTCWLLFQSSLGLGEVYAWIKNGAVLIIEDTDTCTVEPHFMTPHYYGQFSLFPEKALTFSFNSICLIRTPVDVDNRHFFLPNNEHILI